MKFRNNIYIGYIILFLLSLLTACEDFVDLDTPDHITTRETLFATEESATSALNGIYNELINNSFANGRSQSVSFLSGLSGGHLYATNSSLEYLQYEEHTVSEDNGQNLILWSGAYNLIYMVNTVLEGISNSSELPVDLTTSIEGEAKFIRAFTYFHLVNLYGDVPLLLTTDYESNRLRPRDPVAVVESQILQDLQDAIDLLEEGYIERDRTRVNRFTALALMARFQLYNENWEQAELYSSQLIDQQAVYELLALDEVFLADSREAIWQISPIGRGSGLIYTNEGNLFIPNPRIRTFALTPDFMAIWDGSDQRRSSWIGEVVNGETNYYPFKYKIQYDASGGAIQEYSMVMRLAEQYLIRAEARVRMNDLSGGMIDLDVIRSRAGLPLLEDLNPNMDAQQLLDEIMLERQKELFTEWGHRWFDLKRTSRAASVFGGDPQLLYPIPEQERMRNPNL